MNPTRHTEIPEHKFPADLLARAMSGPVEPTATHDPTARYFPVLFISDVHLGAHSCQAESLVAFLRAHVADTIYLVGDIFDNWRPMGANWTAAHHEVVNILLERMKNGVTLIYTPGNHDAFFRQYFGEYFDNLIVADHVFHTAADGTRYLVIHGDTCDVFERRAPILSKIGAHCESLMRCAQLLTNRVLRALDRAEWSGVDYLLGRINALLRAQDKFPERLSDLAVAHGADGIICGHFHKAALHSDHGVVYANCGDWTESCTALAETDSGRLVMLEWAGQGARDSVTDLAADAVAVRA